MSHNGNTTQRWLYSALIDPDKLRSCKICVNNRIKQLQSQQNNRHGEHKVTHGKCGKCSEWDYSNIYKLKCSSPDEYSMESHIDSPNHPKYRAAGERYIKPVQMTYSYLKQGCAYCFYNVFKGKWRRKEAKHTYGCWVLKNNMLST